MQFFVPVVIALHTLTSIFWAGATFMIARGELGLARRASKAVQAASIGAVITGILLWHFTIGGEPQGTGPRTLAGGAVLALVAVGVQVAASRTLKKSVPLGVEHPPKEQGGKALMLYRVSAALLAFTAVSMVISRFI